MPRPRPPRGRPPRRRRARGPSSTTGPATSRARRAARRRPPPPAGAARDGGAEHRGLRAHPVARTRPWQRGHDHVGRRQRHPAERRQAVVRDAAVALPRVRLRDAQRGDRPAAQHRGGVDRLARRDARRSPSGCRSRGSPGPGRRQRRPPRRPAGPRAGRSARVTASRSPPKACPTVTQAASQPASRSPATVRENHAGSAPPSVITYATRAPGPAARGRRRARPAGTSAGRRRRRACRTGRRRPAAARGAASPARRRRAP